MKFYIASRLENAEMVSKLAAVLKAAGHIQTYNWTEHGSVQDEDIGIINQVAENELRGVKSADMVIVLLPGARGTHTELGIALGCGNKDIIICAETNDALLQDGRTCSFYWTTGTIHIIGGFDKWLVEILQTARRIDSERQIDETYGG